MFIDMIAKNNPFNIRNSKKNKWLGQIGSHRGFCCFSEMDFGIRAACVLLANYRKFGLSNIRQIISRFAPPSENDTKAYISYILRCTQLNSSDDLKSDIQYIRVLVAMSEMEGNPVSPDQIFHVVEQFKINFFDPYEKEND